MNEIAAHIRKYGGQDGGETQAFDIRSVESENSQREVLNALSQSGADLTRNIRVAQMRNDDIDINAGGRLQAEENMIIEDPANGDDSEIPNNANLPNNVDFGDAQPQQQANNNLPNRINLTGAGLRERLVLQDEKMKGKNSAVKIQKALNMKALLHKVFTVNETNGILLSPQELKAATETSLNGRRVTVPEWESLFNCAGYLTPPPYCFSQEYVAALTKSKRLLLPQKLIISPPYDFPREFTKEMIFKLLEYFKLRDKLSKKWLPPPKKEAKVTKEHLLKILNTVLVVEGGDAGDPLAFVSLLVTLRKILYTNPANLHPDLTVKPDGVAEEIKIYPKLFEANNSRVKLAPTVEQVRLWRPGVLRALEKSAEEEGNEEP